MPTLLSNISDFEAEPLAQQLNPYWQNLTAGTIDRMLFAASAEAERFCDRKLGAPPQVTLAALAAVGATQLSLTSVGNVHPGDVLVFTTTNEAVEVWGADVTSPYASPYAGTVTLTAPLGTTYALGATAQVYRQDRYHVRGKRTDGWSDAFPASQEGQIARMHAPLYGAGVSARVIFLNEYPVTSLYAAFESLPWNNTETSVNLGSVYLMREAGWYRLPVGLYNPLATIWRTQYLAGFATIPQDVRKAVHYYLAAHIATAMNPIGAVEIRADGQMARITRQGQIAGSPPPRSFFVDEAERLLEPFRRKGH